MSSSHQQKNGANEAGQPLQNQNSRRRRPPGSTEPENSTHQQKRAQRIRVTEPEVKQEEEELRGCVGICSAADMCVPLTQVQTQHFSSWISQ